MLTNGSEALWVFVARRAREAMDDDSRSWMPAYTVRSPVFARLAAGASPSGARTSSPTFHSHGHELAALSKWVNFNVKYDEEKGRFSWSGMQRVDLIDGMGMCMEELSRHAGFYSDPLQRCARPHRMLAARNSRHNSALQDDPSRVDGMPHDADHAVPRERGRP